MSGWAVVAALALCDAALWAALIQWPPPAPPARLVRYCGASSAGTAAAADHRTHSGDDGPWGIRSVGRSRFTRTARLRALRRALPDSLEMLAVCLRAGLGLHAAVAEYAETATGVAREVFRGYLEELAVGRPPDDALAGLARRYPIDEINAAAAAIAQSLRIGAPLADVLEAQAAHCRTLMLHRAREAAQKLSTQLVLPLVAFIFPVVFIIGLGPVALKIARLVGLLR